MKPITRKAMIGGERMDRYGGRSAFLPARAALRWCVTAGSRMSATTSTVVPAARMAPK